MRTRPLVMATVLAVWMSAGGTALAHGGHGGHGGHDADGGHGGGPGGPPRSGEVHHRSGSFSFELSGAQVPAGGDPAARAVAGLRLDPEAEMVCLRANWRDVAGAVTAIHVHRAPEGKTGPHHIDLLDGEHLAGAANRVEFCVQVGGAQGGGGTHAHAAGDHRPASSPAERIQEVVDNPGEFYLNIHSTEFPDGAVRGQIDG
ncbi:MAG TPA: CHRD domain-containing protein [Acidimicrobiia bacterium]|nr:CHRD domain-containing protein [Acidimicrobiia bacterium]